MSQDSSQISAEDFHALFQTLRNWPMPADDLGTLRMLTPQTVRKALGHAREGVTIGLARELPTEPGPSNARPVVHALYPLTEATTSAGVPYAHFGEFIGMRPHGGALTHVDALCHFRYGETMYGGQPLQAGVLSSFGSVSTMSSGVLARAVLLDMPRSFGLDWMEPGQVITAEDLDRVANGQATQVEPGDVILIFTGREPREARQGPVAHSKAQTGLHPESLKWCAERQVIILGSDGTNEVYPGLVASVGFPVHILALVALGMPLIDNLALHKLSEACRARSRWDFLFIMAPLRILGGTGCPVNPIAVF